VPYNRFKDEENNWRTDVVVRRYARVRDKTRMPPTGISCAIGRNIIIETVYGEDCPYMDIAGAQSGFIADPITVMLRARLFLSRRLVFALLFRSRLMRKKKNK